MVTDVATAAQLRAFGRPDLAKKMEAKEKAASRPDTMPRAPIRKTVAPMPGGEAAGNPEIRKTLAPVEPRTPRAVGPHPPGLTGQPGHVPGPTPGLDAPPTPVKRPGPHPGLDAPPTPVKRPGPHPNANARLHANPNARFNRAGRPRRRPKK
jgi:hypothetical protein